jgi:2-haloacid dehalogenase
VTTKALTFDTGGTILDWHGGLSKAFAAAGARRQTEADWAAITNDYRRRSLAGMRDQVRPSFNIDELHRRTLDAVIADHGLGGFDAADREAIWATWHALDAWPDFPAASARLRRKYVVASFTILTVSLVVDVSRRNGIDWDAILSCEMIGTYKTRPESYLTAAKWLGLDPSEIMMVACHNRDLDAARACGFRTGFVRRPQEWGPEGPTDDAPNPANDLIVDDFAELAARLGT